jgi:hypothetical protein
MVEADVPNKRWYQFERHHDPAYCCDVLFGRAADLRYQWYGQFLESLWEIRGAIPVAARSKAWGCCRSLAVHCGFESYRVTFLSLSLSLLWILCVLLIRSNKMQQYAGIYLLPNYSRCFGCPSRPSSGVHKTVTPASDTGQSRIRVTTFLQRGLIRPRWRKVVAQILW